MKVTLKKSQAQEPFSFAFLDGNEKTVMKSENYTVKKSALNGIESVRRNSQEGERFELKESKNGKYYFNLKASNGQVVATSSLFNSEEDRSSAITMVKSEAAQAQLVEI